MTRILVVDYGKSNVQSVIKSLEQAGAEVTFSGAVESMRQADAIVLPGVGSFADAARYMWAHEQAQALTEALASGTPFLGICLGAQLLMQSGSEGLPTPGDSLPGLGLIAGTVIRLESADAAGHRYKVPHVGWNQVHFSEPSDPNDRRLLAGLAPGSNLYFTHSYRACPDDPRDILATAVHAQAIPAIIRRGLAYGVQFHPEKSSAKGLRFLSDFVQLAKAAWG